MSSAFGACPHDVVLGYKPEDRHYESRKFCAPEMAAKYNADMGCVDKSNFYAHLDLQQYAISALNDAVQKVVEKTE